ncbi:MFS transporter [Petralouisia muris]|uniref:MFS transporter n=1 Tax=Petralouisia muris TaxID=3032872 RepID=A0AC61RS04_9FIRM|nr:glycoside-pentoside-hexuronide (GPH):cation symporter [Petralouisia muris]TGY91769.1 MFS transporter [Petralouisia muris]
MDQTKKIPVWRKFAYGCGAGGSNVLSTVFASFLLSYYTDTAMIAAGAVATIMIVCRVLDGVTDFAMGGIIDKTHTKIGKARPWLIIAAPLMCIGLILIFRVNANWAETTKIIYAYLTYIFVNCIVYTILGVAHTALLARMTRDPKDRNTTSTFSSLMNGIVGLFVGTAVSVLYMKLGWELTGIILGVIAGVLILIPGLFCVETVGMDEPVSEGPGGPGPKSGESVPMGVQLKAVLQNRYFWIALILGAIILLINANAIAFQIYYCGIVMGNPGVMTQLMVYGQAPGLIMLLIMPYIANKFSKRIFMAASCIILILGFAVTGMAGANINMLIAGTILRSLGVTPMFAGLYAFCADAADYGEWKTGVRSEGFMASSQSIGSKIGMGLGQALPAMILAVAGYDATQMVQSDKVVAYVRFGFGWLGVILSFVLLLGVLAMNVEKYLPEIRAALGEPKKPPM